MAACDQDDERHGDNPVTLTLSYHNKTGTDKLAEQIHSVDIYLFAVDNRLVSTYRLSDDEIRGGTNRVLSLPQGKYKMITWANVGELSHIVPYDAPIHTSFSAFNVRLSGEPEAGKLTADTIFSNHQTFVVDCVPQKVNIPLWRQTCQYEVMLRGYNSERQPRIVLDGLTNGYNLAGHINGTQTSYAPKIAQDATPGFAHGKWTTLRSKYSDNLRLYLYDNTKASPIIELDLSQALRAQSINTETDMEPYIFIDIQVVSANTITVKVNDWLTTVNINVEL